jgi:hypothetical protein
MRHLRARRAVAEVGESVAAKEAVGNRLVLLAQKVSLIKK